LLAEEYQQSKKSLHRGNDRSRTKQHICASEYIVHQAKDHKNHMGDASYGER
jgi:hypothetical protein